MTLAEFIVLPQAARRRMAEELVKRQRDALARSHPAIQAAIARNSVRADIPRR